MGTKYFLGILKKNMTTFGISFPYLCAFIYGALSALSMPPVHWVLLLIPIFYAVFLLLETTQTKKDAFLLGWAYGSGFFIAGLYWFGYAVKVAGFWYIMPLASCVLPMFLGLFIGFVFLITWSLATTPFGRILCFSLCWGGAEWLRGHILTGLPWNLLGYGWDLPLLQSTAFIGIYGLSLLTILGATIAYTKKPILIFGVWGSIAALWIYGYNHLNQPNFDETDINIRLIQPSIPQSEKWQAEHFQDNIDGQIALSLLPGEKPLKAVIWAEASVPTFVERYPRILEALAEAVPPGGLLLFGAPREDLATGSIYSSLLVLTESAQIIGHYDKAHLVPFGEYFPFSQWLNLPKITHGTKDYSPGTGLQTLHFPGLPPVSPLICYEAIFPGRVVAPKGPRPEWLLNLTNDAWYGHTSGPYQHLQIVRVRAIEEGLPLVRVANNGVSAVIDAIGRITSRLELDNIGFIDFTLPKALPTPPPFHFYKDHFFWTLMLLLGTLLLVVERRKKI